jgi:hypothetical protein
MPISLAKDLSLSVRTDPEKVVIVDTNLSLFCLTNLDAFLSVTLLIGKRVILFEQNILATANVEKVIKIPAVYPITDDFEIQLSAETIDVTSKANFSKKFIVRKKTLGLGKIKGRIINCSDINKIGLEGAKIEIVSGPTIGSTYSEDDGYFSLNNLPEGVYKLGISHVCSTGTVEKVVIVDQNTPFTEVCLNAYGIPDFDFWLNKPSGSNFEIGETITFHLRSSLNMKTDLILSTENESVPLFKDFVLPENEIQNFYWVVPENVSLGEHTLSLLPKDENLCGVAKYLINFSGEMKKGTIQGKATVNGIPLKNVEVYLPLQFNPHVLTDEFGNYEIKNVNPGIHVIRFLADGFEEVDLRGVEVTQNQITENASLELLPSETTFQVLPNPIFSVTHERREKIVPLEVSLTKGFAKDIAVEAIDFPEGMTLSTSFISSLAQEKQEIDLMMSDRLLPNTYSIKVRLKSALTTIEIPGTITVAGLSFGTFDGLVIPKRNTIPQSYQANFIFRSNRFSNFNSPLQCKFLNLPLYTKVIFNEEPTAPPHDFNFSFETSMSTPPGEYKIILNVTGDNQTMAFPFILEVVEAGSSLVTIPDTGWNPLLEPGKKGIIPIATYSYKGLTKSVRINLDYGPNWLVVNNRILGNVGEEAVFAYLEFVPNEFMQPGGYDYSISFSYGERNEGYKKFSGRIYISPIEPDIPSNLRAKFVEENKKIVLTWGPPSKDQENVIGYNVYKSLHYPSLASAFPLNKTLLKDRYYEDLEYKIGKTYWYIVKAVKADGSISKQSNTAELPILTRDKIYLQFQLDKGEKATYFVGEKIQLYFQSNTPGSLSLKLKTENFEMLYDQKLIGQNLPYFLSYPTPDFPLETSIIATFQSLTGQKTEIKKDILIKKSLAGTNSLKGVLWNTKWDEPIPFGKITVFEGSAYSFAESDNNGFFQLNGLSSGSYRLLVETDSTKIVTESYAIQTENVDVNKILISPPMDNSFIIWTTSSLLQTFRRDSLFSLFMKSSNAATFSISIRHNWIDRVLITSKSVEAGRVYYEKLNLPPDLPPGPVFITIRDLQKNSIKSIRITIEEPQSGIWGNIEDIYGSPLKEVSVANALTNEWGFFYLPEVPLNLEIQKKNFVSQNVLSAELIKTKKVMMIMNMGTTRSLQTELSIAEDFNDIAFSFSSSNGISNNFQISFDPETSSYESPKFDLLPDFIYQFTFNNLMQEQVLPDSSLIVKSNGSKSQLKITKGFKEKIFLETDPEIVIFEAGQENVLSLDFYSYGLYKKTLVLSSTFFDSSQKTFFEPVNLIPGNLSLFHINIPQSQVEGMYFFVIQMQIDQTNVQVPLSYTIKEKVPRLIEQSWNPVLYEKSEDRFECYLSEKPTSIKINNFPEGFSTIIHDQSVSIIAKKNNPGLTEDHLELLINETQTLTLTINIETIAQESWVVPEINLTSEKDGVRLQIKKNGYEQYYLISRSMEADSVHFLNTTLFADQDPLDTQVRVGQNYYYSLFSTNGRLEAGWSNQEKIVYNQLSLTLDLKENAITNTVRFQITGSVSIGAELTINNQLVIVEKNGYFKTYVLLKEGKNQLLFLVKDLNGNQLEMSRTIVLDTIPPILKMIDPPLFDINTTEKFYLLRFESESDAYVAVNNIKIVPKNEGFYEYLCQLAPGNNSFTVTANDRAGNQSNLLITFYYYKNIISISLQIGTKMAVVNQKSIPLEVPPQIIQGRTMVPLRFISDSFGARIDWNASTKEIKIVLDNRSIQLQIGSKKAILDSKKIIPLEVPPQIIQGRTMVPLRFISDSFGARIDWNASTKEIKIQYLQPF